MDPSRQTNRDPENQEVISFWQTEAAANQPKDPGSLKSMNGPVILDSGAPPAEQKSNQKYLKFRSGGVSTEAVLFGMKRCSFCRDATPGSRLAANYVLGDAWGIPDSLGYP